MSDTKGLDVFAVPGEHTIIDLVNMENGTSKINGETLAQVQVRYPNAVRVSWETWRAEQIARQNTVVTWETTTAERFEEMLNVLPPVDFNGWSFMVGEPTDHSMETGAPRYQAYRHRGAMYEASNRPLTRKEFHQERNSHAKS